MKIGVFDSGIGGITVLDELRRRFPSVQYVYLGDTAHVPYGTRSPSQIRQLSAAAARVLKSRGIDALVVACNTASSLALEEIQDVMNPIPVFGVVQPGVEAAVSAAQRLKEQKPVLVLATRATVRSGAYGRLLRERLNVVIEQACPLLVPMIEEGWVDHPILHQTIKEYVGSYADHKPRGVALLGCTHYPWIHEAFARALPGWEIVNSAQAISDMLARSVLAAGLSSHTQDQSLPVEWIFTDPDVLPMFIQNRVS